jgi:Tfp pilus assembly protein PilN
VRELEFLPEDYIRARLQRRVRFIRSWLLLALGLAMVLWSLQMGVWVRDARAELEALEGTGSAVEGDVTKVRNLKAEAESYNRRLELLETLRPRIAVADVMATLAALLPQGTTLDEVDLDHPERAGRDRATIRMCGAAPSEDAVTQMLAAIEAAESFVRAVLVESKPLARDGPPIRRAGRAFVIEVEVVAAHAAKE